MIHARPIALALLALGLAAAWSACDGAEGQRTFEDEAFGVPQGINDDGDWLTAPAFRTAGVTVDPAAPNPFSEGQLSIGLYTGLDGLPGEVLVYTRNAEGRLEILRSSPVDPGPGREEIIVIPRTEFQYVGGAGLYRLVIYTGGAVLSYGDVEVR